MKRWIEKIQNNWIERSMNSLIRKERKRVYQSEKFWSIHELDSDKEKAIKRIKKKEKYQLFVRSLLEI